MPGTQTIKVDEEVFDVLSRTASAQGTDINGALRYLLTPPAVPAEPAEDHDEE
ncbi:hypothetical protein [Actinoplanes philippinensis]|uniref:hypothetical protein n=1 Tax=Actinoplanes philippinensis TaxID=35752 RepID=UPI0033E1B3FA